MRAVGFGIAALVLAGCSQSNGQTAPAETPDQATVPSGLYTDMLETDGNLEAFIATPLQRETFGALVNYIGKTLRGEPSADSGERKADIQQWSWALGGTAIKISHALEDGSYGGDTYVYKDAESGDLVYVYITNAGFRTEGVILLNEDGSYSAEEAVNGHPTITKVRSTSKLNEDGSSAMQSEYLDDGEWKPGHSFTYVRTDQPLPRLSVPAPTQP
ncbi:MAG: hypothetical protein AAGF20_08185 [Pseudomonadota bacterium]